MSFVAAFAKPLPAIPVKGGKIQPVELYKTVRIYQDGTAQEQVEVNYLNLSDEDAKIPFSDSPLYGCACQMGDVIVAIGIEDEHWLALNSDYQELEADEKGFIPGMVGAITTAVNDEKGIAHQITLMGGPQPKVNPDKLELP